ncbi:hypothetical protein CTI14_40885, partial [Methylobacterium radiotolerans]
MPAWADLVSEMSQVASNPDVREAMADPRLGDKQRVELFTGLIKADLPQAARNFHRAAGRKRPAAAAARVASQFVALRNRHEGTAQAEITSAFELSALQRSARRQGRSAGVGRPGQRNVAGRLQPRRA